MIKKSTSQSDSFHSIHKASQFSLHVLMLLIVLLILVPSDSSAEKEPIRIGATLSLSGKYEKLSYMVQKGYELWAEEVNRRGGLFERPLKLIFYDDQSDIKLVGPLYEKLLKEDKVDLVLSPYGSSLTLKASEVTEQHNVVMLASSASSLHIWERGYKYIFGIYATSDRYFIGFEDLMARSGLRTLGVIYENSSFNITVANGVRRWAEMFGLEIKYSESFSDPDKELPNIVQQAKLSNIDGLIFSAYPPEGYKFIDLMKKEKYRPKALAISIIPVFSDFYKEVGSFAEGVFGPSQWEPDKRLPFPDTARFIRKFRFVTGKIPTYHACAAYSAGQILEKAILQAGAIDHEKIRNYVTTLDTITIMGRFKVDHSGRQIGHNPIMIQWQKGQKEIVYPTKMRTSPAQM